MKIGVMTQWFAPEPAPIPISLVQFLVGRNHDLKVITGFPNYPTGRLYDGYRQSWAKTEAFMGATVRRVPQYISHDSSGWRRMWSFTSFAITSMLNSGWCRDRDVVYVYATPMTACLSAFYLRWIHRIPYVLHIQDLWPESVIDSGMIGSRHLRRFSKVLIDALLRRVYRDAVRIIAIAPSMADAIEARGAAPGSVSVIYNWAVDRLDAGREEAERFRNRVSSDDRYLMLYAGNVGLMQDVATIVEAAHILGPESGIDFAIVGDGTCLSDVKGLAAKRRVPHLKFIDRIPFDEMGPVYAAADYQLVTLLDRDVFRGTVPSKIGASLAAGLPIITTVLGDVELMCREGGFGWVSEPENPESLAATCLASVQAGREARRAMSVAAARYYHAHLSSEAGLNAVECVLRRSVGRGKSPAD